MTPLRMVNVHRCARCEHHHRRALRVAIACAAAVSVAVGVTLAAIWTGDHRWSVTAFTIGSVVALAVVIAGMTVGFDAPVCRDQDCIRHRRHY